MRTVTYGIHIECNNYYSLNVFRYNIGWIVFFCVGGCLDGECSLCPFVHSCTSLFAYPRDHYVV